jgi:hypothetical protein
LCDFGMHHGLAKELQNAGFPNIQDVQHRQGREFLTPDGGVSVYSLGQIAPTDDWFIPTLEELIEACGKGTVHFLKHTHSDGTLDECQAWVRDGTMKGVGTTPTEAAARLWLALNKKV